MPTLESAGEALCSPPFDAERVKADLPGVTLLRANINRIFEHIHDFIYFVFLDEGYTGPGPGAEAATLYDLAQRVGTTKVVLVVSASPAWAPRDGGSDWVSVAPAEFSEIISQGSLDALRELLKRRVPPVLLSPYQSTRAVVPAMFYGRKHEVVDLRDKDLSFALFGARRIGKTSLAQRVLREVQANAPYRYSYKVGGRAVEWSSVAYVEMHRLARIGDLWRELLAEMGFPTRDLIPGARFRVSLKGKRQFEPRDEIEIIRRVLTTSSDQALFLLDEVDRAIRLDRENGYPVFTHLQSLMDDRACKLRVVLFGYEELLRAFRSDSFPLNHSRLREKKLGPLTAAEVGQLLAEPMQRIGVRIDHIEQSRDSVRVATGGMPNLVQELCHSLLGLESVSRRRLVTETDIKNALEQPSFRERIDAQFAQVTESLPRFIAFLMSDMSDLKEFDTETVQKRIREKHHLAVNDHKIDEALDQLKLYSILEKAGEKEFVFASQALRARLRSQATEDRLAQLKQSIAVQLRGRNQ
jgi:hypothetical protein